MSAIALDLRDKLERLRIQEFRTDIFEMSRSALREHFKYGKTINSSKLLKNLIWQDYGKLRAGALAPFRGNIRSYWYARAKPVLARADAPDLGTKYDMMIQQFALMVVEYRLFNYGEFGFKDEGQHNRQLGAGNRHVFLVAEKVGHLPFLEDLAQDYGVTIIALGGHPSALSSEYLVAELQVADFHPEGPVPLLAIVDFDPQGDLIAEGFIRQLAQLGFPAPVTRLDLAHPSRMTHEQIALNKFQVPRRKSERKKNQRWVAKTGGLLPYGYGNDEYNIYGLEADAMTWEQLTAAFDQEAAPYLKVPREVVVRRRLKRELVEVMKELLLTRLLG